MSLRTKIVLVLLSVLAAYAGADYVAQQTIVSRTVASIQREKAGEDLERVRTGLDQAAAELAALAVGGGLFFADAGRGSERLPEWLERGKLDLLYLCEDDGTVVWGRIVDPVTRETVRVRGLPSSALAPTHPLLTTHVGAEELHGLLTSELGPMVVASRTIRSEGDRGAARCLILGRFLKPRLLEELRERSGVQFAFWQIPFDQLPDEAAVILERSDPATAPVVEESRDGSLAVYHVLTDYRDQPSFLARLVLDRSVARQSLDIARYSQLSTSIAALLLLFVLTLLLNRVVTGPLSRLTRHAARVGQSEDTDTRIDVGGADEVGMLGREFNRMLEKLAASRAETVKTARLAGMSEIAAGILHNVGNVLNSVHVSASIARSGTEHLGLHELREILEVLERNREHLGEFLTEDPKGRHFLPFFAALTESLERKQQGVVDELASLMQGIEHVEELVSSQQNLTGRVGVVEKLSISELLEESVRLCDDALGELRIEIVRDYDPVPPVEVERHRTLEVLVNLIQNARESMTGDDGRRAVLTLRVKHGAAGQVRIEVSDTGDGIARKDLKRIFNQGFRAKGEGHGFGLHSAANSATEMGCALRADSAGLGHGATFTLELPVERAATKPPTVASTS